MTIKELQKDIHRYSVSKGWWKRPIRRPLEIHALIHSEVAEATEAYRDGTPEFCVEEGKPEGEAAELADVIIRILDYSGFKGWNMEDILDKKMAYNKTRPFRHGGKKA